MRITQIETVRRMLWLTAGLLVASGSGIPLGSQEEAVETAQDRPTAEDRGSGPRAADGDDLITAGRHVRIEDEVEGDVAAAGAEVSIQAPVSGYVMSAGRNVRLDGRVGNDLWAAGETVDVDGAVANNAMVAGRVVHLHPGATIGNDASVAGNTVMIEGRIERDLNIGASTARIAGDIGGSVDARAARVSLLPGASVRGDLLVRAQEPPEISPDARVLGQVRYQHVEQGPGSPSWPFVWLLGFGAILTLGLALNLLAPAWPAKVAETLRRRAIASFLSGLAVFVLAPLAAVVLAVTVVGIPLAVVLGALYVTALVLAGVFVSHRVGDWVLRLMNRPQASPWERLAVGALVVSLGVSLPFVGWLVLLAVLITGAGSLVLERSQRREAVPGR
ncbi:MAG TPA: hypothetical protein PKK95_00735 [Vicinamibacterales bacterium]|nr:hypothetical protein [Acidobacteriota bacterium]HOC16758.1 hypothetical protein [Vicinamibacterales bacterium]